MNNIKLCFAFQSENGSASQGTLSRRLLSRARGRSGREHPSVLWCCCAPVWLLVFCGRFRGENTPLFAVFTSEPTFRTPQDCENLRGHGVTGQGRAKGSGAAYCGGWISSQKGLSGTWTLCSMLTHANCSSYWSRYIDTLYIFGIFNIIKAWFDSEHRTRLHGLIVIHWRVDASAVCFRLTGLYNMCLDIMDIFPVQQPAHSSCVFLLQAPVAFPSSW